MKSVKEILFMLFVGVVLVSGFTLVVLGIAYLPSVVLLLAGWVQSIERDWLRYLMIALLLVGLPAVAIWLLRKWNWKTDLKRYWREIWLNK